MKPVLIDRFGGNSDEEIYDAVKEYHQAFRAFKWTVHSNVCGVIHFYGENSIHSATDILVENPDGQFEEYAEFISNSKEKFHAVSITLFRVRNTPNGKQSLKETCYINAHNSNAILLDTYMEDTGLGVPVFSSHTEESTLPFSYTANVTHDILDALNIFY